MNPKPPKESRRIGRPPAGARDGEKVKDYPQLSVRLPAEVKAKLHAISQVSARPQWRLITEAIDCYLKGRPEAEQRMVDELLSSSEDVGKAFPEEARRIHYQEAPARSIRGQTTSEEHAELLEEGIAVLRLPIPPRDAMN